MKVKDLIDQLTALDPETEIRYLSLHFIKDSKTICVDGPESIQFMKPVEDEF